jgi:hypothetical protein
MDQMTSSAVFLCSSILISLGIIVIIGMIVIINNILHKYWKPLGWKFFDTPHYVFVDKADEPKLDSPKKAK